jgi:hypothetical protein
VPELRFEVPDVLVDAIVERVAERLERPPKLGSTSTRPRHTSPRRSRASTAVLQDRVEHRSDGRRVLFRRAWRAGVASAWLDEVDQPYDVANAPAFGNAVDWRSADPDRYSDVLFVCGPVHNHGGRELAARVRGKRRCSSSNCGGNSRPRWAKPIPPPSGAFIGSRSDASEHDRRSVAVLACSTRCF